MTPRRKIHRSGLTMPINNPRFVNAAWTRGCDGFTLDLEDSVPQAQKAHARTLVQQAIQTAGQGGGKLPQAAVIQRRLPLFESLARGLHRRRCCSG